MLMGEEMWNTTMCPTHSIEYYGCFCPECFMPKGTVKKAGSDKSVNVDVRVQMVVGQPDYRVEKLVNGVWVDCTPDQSELTVMKALLEKWRVTRDGKGNPPAPPPMRKYGDIK